MSEPLTPGMELTIRGACFAGVLLVMAGWELLAPRRVLIARKKGRWISNLALLTLNTILARVVMPMTAVAMAVLAETHGWGLLPRLGGPPWLKFLLGVVVLDFAIYVQHVLFHAVPVLWRVHRVHHADLDFDVTTGVRFHTVEILLSAIIKLATISVLGPPAFAVITFEVLLNACSMFSHSNVRLPLALDRLMRLLFVTPDMHRIHHSVISQETNSNYGFCLPWWDRLLGTYRAQPEAGHEEMTIGLPTWRDEGEVDRLGGMLRMPFRRHQREC